MADEARASVVLDWDGRPMGRVQGALRHARTGALRSLVVQLTPEARAQLKTPDFMMAVPAKQVVSLRRGEVVLDRTLEEMARGQGGRGMPPAA